MPFFSLPDAPEKPPIKTNLSSLTPSPPFSHHAFLFLLNPRQLLSLSGLQPRASRASDKPHKERNKQKEQQRLCGFNLALSSSDAPKGKKCKKKS